MSMFKFHDSNFLNGFNRSDIVATVDTYNGNQFALSNDTAVPFTNAAGVQTGDGYVMMNIIDKPEILNTDDYYVTAGEYIRAFRLKDYVGLEVDLSEDLISDAWADVAVGNYLVGRSADDTTETMGWKKAADVSSYEIYLVVKAKTTFGSYTTDKAGGTVKGGYLCEIKSSN